jgi:hypothetical protein
VCFQFEPILLSILSTREHPLCLVTENFIALFRELYSRQSGIMETTKIAAATLEK